jgi:hypothetical protein
MLAQVIMTMHLQRMGLERVLMLAELAKTEASKKEDKWLEAPGNKFELHALPGVAAGFSAWGIFDGTCRSPGRYNIPWKSTVRGTHNMVYLPCIQSSSSFGAVLDNLNILSSV